MEDPFTNLPTDLLLDILSRLPLGSISHSRWVCKAWHALLLTPRFAKLHHSRSLRNKSPCVSVYGFFQHFYLTDDEIFNNLQTSTTALNVKMRQLSKVFRTVGLIRAVNGLVCFSPESDIDNHMFMPSPLYICNLITAEYVELPRSPKFGIAAFVSGFGYDSVGDDYKVIRILKDGRDFLAEVYSLSTGNWKVIKDVPTFFSSLPQCNVFVNGSLHWITHCSADLVIVCFNVETEKFSIIDLPLHVEKTIIGGFTVLGETLCLITGEFRGDQDVWLMRDYGKQDSWTKECVITREAFSRIHNWGDEITQLKNGELVLINHKGEIGYYDTKVNVFRPITIHGLEKESPAHIRRFVVQMGSLLSPKHVGTHSLEG